MKEKKKTRSEIKREAILEAAMSAFQEFGVQNTSMDKLASLANVSKRTVYNHFSSKEALVFELLKNLWETAAAKNEAVFDDTKSLQLQLSDLLCIEIETMGDKQYLELAKVAFGHYFYQPEALQKQAENMSKRETAVYSWIASATEAGKIQVPDFELASHQIYNLLKGSAFWPQLLGYQPSLDSQQREQLAAQTTAMFLSHYKVK